MNHILTLNAGSSSLKYKLFCPELVLGGIVENIGESCGIWTHTESVTEKIPHRFATHAEALEALVQKFRDYRVDAVGHRVVHGGERWFEPVCITPEVLAAIDSLAPLAPLHNPANATGIRVAQQVFPKARQVAVFDTGFHHTLPEYAHRYAIDRETADRYQIRRYGFHGINHDYVTREAARFLGKPREQCDFISLHLGNGASACLVRAGKSVDTSMGMTPLAGLVMGSRCGDIDPAIALYLQRQGMSAESVDTLFNQKSGLAGIAGDNDMRRLLAREDAGDADAALAIAMYIHSIRKMIGAYLSETTHLDALIFTGGVGENAASIRERILTPLAHFGFMTDTSRNSERAVSPCHPISTAGIPVLVIRGDEEQYMAELVRLTISA